MDGTEQQDLIDLTLVLHDARWRKLVPDTEQFARRVILAALQGVANRLPARRERLPEIACLFTNDAEIRILNRQFRGKDKATNVLSFSADRAAPSPEDQPIIIGDLILSIDTIEREAQEQGKTFADHATHMLVHGILHLFDYDHQHDRDADDMEALERDILRALGVGDPYQDQVERDSVA